MLIDAGNYKDERGEMSFFNDLPFPILRIYTIAPSIDFPIRAWQGHVKEEKLFQAEKGSFEIALGNFENNEVSNLKTFILEENDGTLVYASRGCVNGIKSLKEGSVLRVYSNMNLDDSNKDLVRFPYVSKNGF